MANVAKFNTSLQKFGQDIPKIVGQLQRRAALSIMSDLIKGSPVDTGRFRGSWMVGIGVADRAKLSEKRAGARGRANESKRKKAKRLNTNSRELGGDSMSRVALLTPSTVTGKDPIIISNNLPYGQRLAEGSSKQAPSGWIDAAVQRAARVMNKVKITIGRA